MRYLKSFLASLLLFAGRLLADDAAPVPLKYDQMVLTDGRTLRKVVVKSYDAKTEKLLMLADGKAMSLPVALVPDPLGARLKAGAPKAGGSTTSTQERAVYAPVILPTGPGGTPKVISHAVKSSDQKMQSHLDAARSVARTQAMSNNLRGVVRKVEIINCELEDPVAVEGWIDRYKTRGTITYNCLDAAGAPLRKGSTRFEVTTEFPPNRGSAGTLNYVELTETGAPQAKGPRLTPHPFENLEPRPAPPAPVVRANDPFAAHKQAARDRAQKYYEATFATTNRGAPAMDFELGELEPVPAGTAATGSQAR